MFDSMSTSLEIGVIAMKYVRPSRLVKAQTPELDEVEIHRLYRSMSRRQQVQVIETVKGIDDPILQARATKLLRAAYVV
jgi:hypothetical protein